MALTTTQKKFKEILEDYRAKYNVDALDSPNDVANLNSMIRNQILIEQLQAQLDILVTNTNGEKYLDPTHVKKMLDSIVALSETNIALERTLGIDRKTRKQEASESVADYLTTLRIRAKEWLDNEDRLRRVMCKSCNIMIGRISGVYDTTAYEAGFQCPQCSKYTVIRRKERDVFFDIKDADWRRKYPIEIEHPKRVKSPTLAHIEDDITIGAEYPEDTITEEQE